MELQELVKFLDETLKLKEYSRDCSNNGLQVESNSDIQKIALAVDGVFESFEKAKEINADMILVHHGISWGSYPKRFTSYTGKRMQYLFQNGISLYAAHLPLDANKDFGNNAELAKMISLNISESFFEYDGVKIGFAGTLSSPKSVSELADIYSEKLNVKAKIYGNATDIATKIAICSGGGGSESLVEAKNIGANLLVTGEFDHVMYHLQKELRINVLALGHYASETVGVQALGKIISEKFDIPCEFIDIPTGL